MSLRDYFAAQAMQAFVLFPGELQEAGKPVERTHVTVARAAYAMADAMLQVRTV